MTTSRHLRALSTVLASTAALAVLAGPAAAAASKPVPYTGKTSGGTKITFKLDKKGWIQLLTTAVPATCVSAQGGTPKAMISPYTPPFQFRLGMEGKAKAKGWPTTYYTVATKRASRTRITGTLKSSWSMTVPDAWGGWKIDTCVASASFSASPR